MANVLDRMRTTIAERGLGDAESGVLLMVSGGSDSTALAYAAADLAKQKVIGPVAMLHVNHRLRGQHRAFGGRARRERRGRGAP